jgi:hypothetical protein
MKPMRISRTFLISFLTLFFLFTFVDKQKKRYELTSGEKEVLLALERQVGQDVPVNVVNKINEENTIAGMYRKEGKIVLAKWRDSQTLNHEIIHFLHHSAGEMDTKLLADSVEIANRTPIMFQMFGVPLDNINFNPRYMKRPHEQIAFVLQAYVPAALGTEEVPAVDKFQAGVPTGVDSVRVEFVKGLIQEAASGN